MTGLAVAGMLASVSLEDRSPELRAAYARATSQVVAGGQRQAGEFALAYVGAYLPAREPPDLEEALDVMTPENPGALVGLLALWSMIDEGAEELAARLDAGNLAASHAEVDMQRAVRDGLDEGARISHRSPRWRLEPNDDACEWCRFIGDTGARYLDAGSVPIPHGVTRGGPCGCEPALEEEEEGEEE